MSRREYEIMQDQEGFYIATEDGFDLCRIYRFGSFADAEKRMHEWEQEDEEAQRWDSSEYHEPPSVKWEDA